MYNLKRYIFENIKENLPDRLNEFILLINKNPNIIFGKEYKKYFKTLTKFHGVNPNLTKNVLDIVNFTLTESPYYKKHYKKAKITTLEDFEKEIEPIDKQVVLNNFEDFIIDSTGCDLATTGGTSGKPLSLYLPKNRYITELATLHYVWSKIGYNFSSRASIRNQKLPENKDYLINPLSKEYIFDGFRLNDNYFEIMFQTMKKKRILFLHGYTSNLYLFGQFLIKYKKDYSFIKGLFTSSENVTEEMQFFFDNILQIPHLNFYGHTEKLVFGSYCAGVNNFHIDSFYGYTEVINQSGRHSNFGEITGTTLHNRNMPLLRYRTGDYATVKGNYCNYCAYDGLILEKIYGRWDGSKIFNKDNTYITTTALNLHSDIYRKVNGIQYFQGEKGKLEIRIIRNELFTNETENELLNEFKNKLNNDFEFRIKYVNDLEKNSNGKFLMLISKI